MNQVGCNSGKLPRFVLDRLLCCQLARLIGWQFSFSWFSWMTLVFTGLLTHRTALAGWLADWLDERIESCPTAWLLGCSDGGWMASMEWMDRMQRDGNGYHPSMGR